MSESLVDLLLVRLGREEEKRKVLKLLVTSLDLSMSDAEEAVNNSPSVIREAVPMGEARAIQKDLYPYIDLLPRFDDEEEDNVPAPATAPAEEIPEAEFEEEEIDEEADEEIRENGEEEAEEEDDILITSARDEVRSTNRCHICGRTPTDGEKLAPCRTCSDLTCRDCFDRIAHVCSKCAASGKAIEHANEGVEPERDEGLVFDSDETQEEAKPSGSSAIRYAAVGLFFLAALAAVFYFMDPMNLFGDPEGITEPSAGIPADTTGPQDPDTLQIALPDTMAAQPDTIPADTASVAVQGEDPLGLAGLALSDEYSVIADPPPIPFRTSAPASVGATVLDDEMEIMAEQLSVIAAWIPVELDDAVLLQYHDTTQVLVLSLRHPEETETRLELLRRVSHWLTPSGVDQLVLLYRENRYQNTVIMSLVSSNFPNVQGVISPVQFQDFLSYREDCWESISGPVSSWLAENQ